MSTILLIRSVDDLLDAVEKVNGTGVTGLLSKDRWQNLVHRRT